MTVPIFEDDVKRVSRILIIPCSFCRKIAKFTAVTLTETYYMCKKHKFGPDGSETGVKRETKDSYHIPLSSEA